VTRRTDERPCGEDTNRGWLLKYKDYRRRACRLGEGWFPDRIDPSLILFADDARENNQMPLYLSHWLCNTTIYNEI
jgi:hypothetical protein